MTTKKKNDNPNLLKRNALIISIAFNILLVAMFLLLYVPTLAPPPPLPQGSPDPFQLTATQLIKTATEGALVQMGITVTPSSTFAPATLSGEDETALREQFLNELETDLGFLHPDLEDNVDIYIRSIRSEIERYNDTGYGITDLPEEFIQGIARTSFENVEYVAVIIPIDRLTEVGQGFIFKIVEDLPELLARADLADTLDGFGDRNGNGFPDIIFQLSPARGNNITIYEIRPNNRFFANLTTNLNASIWRFVDLDEDGIFELEGTQRLYIPEGVVIDKMNRYVPIVPRWFFWNGEEYEAYPVIAGE